MESSVSGYRSDQKQCSSAAVKQSRWKWVQQLPLILCALLAYADLITEGKWSFKYGVWKLTDRKQSAHTAGLELIHTYSTF